MRARQSENAELEDLTVDAGAAHLAAMSQPPAKPDPKALREAQLAKALRDNLRRRKAAPREIGRAHL